MRRLKRHALRVEQAAVGAIVAPVGAKVRGEGEVVAGAGGLAGLAEGAAKAEVGVIVDAVGRDHRLELDRRLCEAPGPVIGAAEGLADR
jgi:hypothetical protein